MIKMIMIIINLYEYTEPFLYKKWLSVLPEKDPHPYFLFLLCGSANISTHQLSHRHDLHSGARSLLCLVFSMKRLL